MLNCLVCLKTGDVIPMPVPSSYNDITQDRHIRDFMGWAWYDTQFFLPPRWKSDKDNVILRFGSVNYAAVVYINGVNVVNHTGGHLPFQADITDFLEFDKLNLLTVAVDNILTEDTVPQGSVTYFKNDRYPKNFYETEVTFDFFNYAGIHRSVQLYAIPSVHIDDITVTAEAVDYSGSTGEIHYSVKKVGEASDVNCVVEVY